MCNYVSNLSDGSTDVSINEQEVVYVRYVCNGENETDLIDIMDLKSSWAQGDKVGSEISVQPTHVCANFDGASVMHGLKSGTMKLILTASSIA